LPIIGGRHDFALGGAAPTGTPPSGEKDKNSKVIS
jgi:hypothetical protein